jgi:diguanylate cyclase (GGDEF)-like protein
MSVDINKHFERAKKYLEKNKLQDAVEEYKAVLAAYPNHQETIQALGDTYTRMNDSQRAAQYYGMLFDRLSDTGDATKATALYARFLKGVQQTPERMMRYALLLQRQNRRDEAVEFYSLAADGFLATNSGNDALACWEKICTLDPENPSRHIQYGEIGEMLGRGDVASRGFLRSAQLLSAVGQLDFALDYLSRANRLAPSDRSVALFYAEALVKKGKPQEAVRLLEPFPLAEADPSFLSMFGTALMDAAQFKRAREVLEQLYREKPDMYEKLFDLTDRYLRAQHDAGAVDTLRSVKERMFAAKRANEFTAQLDRLFESHPRSVALAEFCGQVYDELNRESKYFSVLTHLFDLYLDENYYQGASGVMDRIVDIDPYDQHNHARLDRLKGKVDESYLRGIASRLGKSFSGSAAQGSMRELQETATHSGLTAGSTGASESKEQQTLEDLIVQAEIFMQYSLQNKAVERLQKIAEMFPGEEEKNARLRNLYDTANWWPPTAKKKPAEVAAVPATPVTQTGTFSADTVRDLTKVSEITRAIHRQSTPKSVLSTAVNEIGSYMRVTRCVAAVGPQGQPPQMAAEFCSPGVEPSKAASVVKLIAALSQAKPDDLGALTQTSEQLPILSELGLDTVLGVPLTDKETQAPSGMLVAGNAGGRKWKPNESYFLQAVGDQVMIGVNHTKLRSLMRNLAVADEKTGLLGRGSYMDALLSESGRAKSQNTPLSLVILQVDKGLELIRQQGEPQFEKHMEQVARALQSTVRQNDLAVKYTGWAVAFILPDTKLADAQNLAEKLRKVSSGIKPPWNGSAITLSASVVEAQSKPEYDSEDIVTDLINRAEFALEEARKKGGDVVQTL